MIAEGLERGRDREGVKAPSPSSSNNFVALREMFKETAAAAVPCWLCGRSEWTTNSITVTPAYSVSVAETLSYEEVKAP